MAKKKSRQSKKSNGKVIKKKRIVKVRTTSDFFPSTYPDGNPRANAGELRSSTIRIANRFRKLENFARWLAAHDFKELNRILFKGKGVYKGSSKPPKKATVILAQRNRQKPHQVSYQSFVSPPEFVVNRKNVKGFTVGVIENFEEHVRREIIKRGFKGVKYDEGNFKAWHVPFIEIKITY